MRDMRVEPELKCVACQHYKVEGISERCIQVNNTFNSWIGTCYKLHPSTKNLRGRCKYYEENN